jgi:NitT/TauT family transport system substrate-binding protein
MPKNFWKQFLIALALFLAGYFTFNSNLFAQTLGKPEVPIAVGEHLIGQPSRA